MCTFILKSYNRKSEIKNPHFFILNKGNNSGKPLVSPCPNCFVIQFQCIEEKEQVYWLLFSLWQSRAFYPFLRGSVIPFVVLRDVKSCIVDGLVKAEANPAQFQKSRDSIAQPGRNGKEIQTKSETRSGCKADAFPQIFVKAEHKKSLPAGRLNY